MKIRSGQHSSHYADEENPYWISFSDIMSGLLVIFILATLALILDLMETRTEVSEAIKELANAEQVRKDILYEIQKELREKKILVTVSDNDTVLRIPDDLLTFKSNKVNIPKGMENTAEEIGRVLYKAISKEKRWLYLDTIFIEGHTDILPSKRFKGGNWGLSTYRAISVWQHWKAKLPENMQLYSLTNHANSPLFSVSGYAATRPLTLTQKTAENRQKNRRIDIRFTVKRPSLQDLNDIKVKMVTEK